MAASYEDVKRWIKQGLKEGAVYVISVCDCFDYDDYPVYVMPNQDHQAFVREYNSKEMQKVNEVIFLDDPFNEMILEAKRELQEEATCEATYEKVLEKNDPGHRVANEIEKENEMNAARARQMTEENILNSSNGIKAKIDALIVKAIEAKTFSVGFEVPPAAEKEILKKHYCDKGFGWKQNSGGDQRDPYPATITLSW